MHSAWAMHHNILHSTSTCKPVVAHSRMAVNSPHQMPHCHGPINIQLLPKKSNTSLSNLSSPQHFNAIGRLCATHACQMLLLWAVLLPAWSVKPLFIGPLPDMVRVAQAAQVQGLRLILRPRQATVVDRISNCNSECSLVGSPVRQADAQLCPRAGTDRGPAPQNHRDAMCQVHAFGMQLWPLIGIGGRLQCLMLQSTTITTINVAEQALSVFPAMSSASPRLVSLMHAMKQAHCWS